MKIYNYILASALLVSVAACCNDDNMPSQYETDSNVVRIQPSVCGISESRTSPKKENSTVFNIGDKICVSSKNKSAYYTYEYKGNDTWIPEILDGSYFKWDDNQNTDGKMVMEDFTAYYPSEAGMTSFEIPSDQSTAE